METNGPKLEPTNEELQVQLREMSARRLVRWLTAPSQSGFYFSPADLQRLGREIGVGVVPFGRANGIEQLLRGAALDEKLNDAIQCLEIEMRAHLAEYRKLDLPTMQPWIDRAEHTIEAWSQIAQASLADDMAAESD